ncbi:MAG: hypothetical protein QW223_09240 [Candidatus Caldarchaeum sp.]
MAVWSWVQRTIGFRMFFKVGCSVDVFPVEWPSSTIYYQALRRRVKPG